MGESTHRPLVRKAVTDYIKKLVLLATGGNDPGSQLSTFPMKLTVTNDAGSADVTIVVTEDAGADVCII